MATNRGTRWANTELLNLHSSLNELLICIENEKTNTSRKGRRQRAPRNTVKQALDDVREDLDDIAKHPYNIVHSSANPGDKRLKPEARGSVRRLYTELKRLLESPDPGYHEEKVEEHLKSLVSMLVPNPPEAEATAKGKVLIFPFTSVQMSSIQSNVIHQIRLRKRLQLRAPARFYEMSVNKI